MPELGSYGSVRGARGNSRPYREHRDAVANRSFLTLSDTLQTRITALRKDHSITSLACASKLAGTEIPSNLAVYKLMTSSNFVACMTGKSDGLSPLRM